MNEISIPYSQKLFPHEWKNMFWTVQDIVEMLSTAEFNYIGNMFML